MNVDIAIVGAGVFGLAMAREQAKRGKSVLLLDAGTIGSSGASAGLLGALMPASPTSKNPLSNFQLYCLNRYADRMAELEAPTGYRRAGRLERLAQPIDFAARCDAARQRWGMLPELLSAADASSRFGLVLGDAPHGYMYDGMTAQITPRLLLAALLHDIKGKVTLQADTQVLSLQDNKLHTTRGWFTAQKIIATAGVGTKALTGAPIKPVKGQAFSVASLAHDKPILYQPNSYVIFHDGSTAVGSTTEKNVDNLTINHTQIREMRERAMQLLPPIGTADITETWAGLRPRAATSLPYIAQTAPHIYAVSGGYKIGFALAFEVAHLVSSALERDENALASPENFWNFVATTHIPELFSPT